MRKAVCLDGRDVSGCATFLEPQRFVVLKVCSLDTTISASSSLCHFSPVLISRFSQASDTSATSHERSSRLSGPSAFPGKATWKCEDYCGIRQIICINTAPTAKSRPRLSIESPFVDT